MDPHAEHTTIELPQLANAIVIVLRAEESQPIVGGVFSTRLDMRRAVSWVATQPELVELLERALALAGDDLQALDPDQLRRMFEEGV